MFKGFSYLSLCSKHILSFGTFNFLDISFLRLSIVSVLVTAKSNWPPVVGVTEIVIVDAEEFLQPHPKSLSELL